MFPTNNIKDGALEKMPTPPIESAQCNKFLLDVHTFILILELTHLDMEKRTCNVWVELGFCYDVHDYFRTFDSQVRSDEKENDRMTRLRKVAAEDFSIPFDIVNAVEMGQRSEAHFIRECDGYPGSFYTESEEFNNNLTQPFLSDAKKLVNHVDISECPQGKYWKHETRTYNMELAFSSTSRLAPFDHIYLFFKLITANCQPGTNRIKFKFNEKESDFSGMKVPLKGYHPFTDGKGKVQTITKCAHSYSNSDICWDRFYVAVPFKRRAFEDIFTYYVVPFLLLNFMVIKPIEDSTELLGISSTLVIANVALLIVSRNNTFAFFEQAVLIQIIVLIIATLMLAYFDDNEDIDWQLACANFGIFVLTLGSHYTIARRENAKILDHIKRGDFSALNTL